LHMTQRKKNTPKAQTTLEMSFRLVMAILALP
jgi:hypothetical protein